MFMFVHTHACMCILFHIRVIMKHISKVFIFHIYIYYNFFKVTHAITKSNDAYKRRASVILVTNKFSLSFFNKGNLTISVILKSIKIILFGFYFLF